MPWQGFAIAPSGDKRANQLLAKFREMHQRGHLDQAEYRTIKRVLAEKIQDELKDGGETG